MSKIIDEEHEGVPEYVQVFCQFMDTTVNACTVAHLHSNPIPKVQQLEHELAQLEIKDTVVVFVDCGGFSAAGKLMALLTRNRTVRMIGRTLQQNGLAAVHSYALYPNAKRVTFVYERGTSAARYAETMLLTAPGQPLLRRAYALFSRFSTGSPSIELLAVIGKRR